MTKPVDYHNTDDEMLLRLIAQAHEEALAVLYERYGRLVFGVALHVVGRRHTAEEIVLDVFTSVWEKASLYRAERARVSVWLASMARYRAIDVLRREAVRPEKYSVSWVELAREPVAQSDNPEKAVDLALQKQRVRAAVATLPEEQREALALAFFKGYTHSEIAQVLDQPLGTIKTRIRMAMHKLRQLLQDE